MIEHIAIIPDGNRRWTKLHRHPVLEGHRRGAKVMHAVVDYLTTRVKYLTVWGFSIDNWKRSEDEIQDLLHLLAFWIDKDAPWLDKKGIRLRHIGRISELPDFLQLAINEAVELTSDNKGMALNLAFNYTGRGEIVDAVRRLVKDNIPSQAIDESVFTHYLYTDGMSDVDLVIRTAGELRLSNFLIWQTAYSEFYFTEVLWPDFNIEELEKALEVYSQRQRRFGAD